MQTKNSPTEKKKSVGRPKGTPRTGGRQKGTGNAITVTMKQQLEGVFDRLGGVDGLLRWAQKDPANLETFYSRMWIRLLPKDIKAEINGTLNSNTFTPEQMKNMAKAFLEQSDQ